MYLNEKLTNLAKIQNLTQNEIAQKLGVRQATVSSWLTGRTKPDIDQIQKLANEVFIVSIEYLITNDYIEYYSWDRILLACKNVNVSISEIQKNLPWCDFIFDRWEKYNIAPNYRVIWSVYNQINQINQFNQTRQNYLSIPSKDNFSEEDKKLLFYVKQLNDEEKDLLLNNLIKTSQEKNKKFFSICLPKNTYFAVLFFFKTRKIQFHHTCDFRIMLLNIFALF